jgi:sugar transferase (PEP-CTERM/EpsH1 system associated)
MRICHVLLSLRPGGLENGVVNVINGLDRQEFVSAVCCLQQRGEFADRIADERCEVLEFGLQPGTDIGLPWRLARAFRRLRPDIVHTRNAEAFYYGAVAAKLAGVPAVVHSEHGRVFPEKWHRALVQRLMLRDVTCAFAVSRQLADAMVTEIGVRPGKFKVIYNGVDTLKFGMRSRTGDRGAEQGEVIIGSVGRLAAVKNYGFLLRTVARLPRELRWRLVLIGDGPERTNLVETIRELDLNERVELLGHRDDVADLLPRFDIFVLPSVSEGMSNTLLEAMAAGVAVVASNVGGNPEIIEPGRSGLLFPSGDLAAAVREISSLVTDPWRRAQLADAGAARAEKTFGMRVMLNAYEELYRAVWRTKNAHVTASVVA